MRPVTQYWMVDNNNNDSDYTMPLKEADPHNLAMFAGCMWVRYIITKTCFGYGIFFACKCIPDIEHMMQMGIIWTSKIRHGIQPARINTGKFNPAIMGIQTCKQLNIE